MELRQWVRKLQHSQHGCEFFIILIKNTQSAFTAHATVAIGKVQNELLT